MLRELSEEEFAKRAARSGRVAVFKEFLADRETPVAALTRLGDDEVPITCLFLLPPGRSVRWCWSFMVMEARRRPTGRK